MLPKTAFVLDDEPQVGALVCKVLGSMGIAARAFCAPAHFFAELEGSQPDLVVLDLALKGSDAIEVIRRLEELRFTGSVMLISGRDQGTLEEIERIGVAHGLAMLPSLQKPFRATDLRKKLACEPLGGAPAEPRAAERVPANGCVVHLEEALERSWLEVWYQAKIDLKSMTICGAEALVRARHPEHGVVAPGRVPTARRRSALPPAVVFVLRCAMADWAIFADHGAALKLSVNSPVSVLHAPDFISLIRRSLPDDGRFPGLILEVTEDEIIRDAGWMHEVAAQLRLYNVSLSIDDFGSAYASLARLRDLPFVEIKLDRGFVESCADNPLNRGVCATVIDLAHRFQASLCAEGVETEEDLHCLMAMGCDTAQGYLFAKPMPRDTFVQLLGAQPISFERLRAAARKRAAKG